MRPAIKGRGPTPAQVRARHRVLAQREAVAKHLLEAAHKLAWAAYSAGQGNARVAVKSIDKATVLMRSARAEITRLARVG